MLFGPSDGLPGGGGIAKGGGGARALACKFLRLLEHLRSFPVQVPQGVDVAGGLWSSPSPQYSCPQVHQMPPPISSRIPIVSHKVPGVVVVFCLAAAQLKLICIWLQL